MAMCRSMRMGSAPSELSSRLDFRRRALYHSPPCLRPPSARARRNVSPHAAGAFERVEIRQVAQAAEPEDLEEARRRHPGDRRAGFWGARAGRDGACAFQPAEDVAAGVASGKARELALVIGCR